MNTNTTTSDAVLLELAGLKSKNTSLEKDIKRIEAKLDKEVDNRIETSQLLTAVNENTKALVKTVDRIEQGRASDLAWQNKIDMQQTKIMQETGINTKDRDDKKSFWSSFKLQVLGGFVLAILVMLLTSYSDDAKYYKQQVDILSTQIQSEEVDTNAK